MKRMILIATIAVLVLGGGAVFYSRFMNRPQVTPEPAATPLSGMASAAGGFGHSLAVTTDRTVWAWGRNNAGQLGDGTLEDRDAAKQIAGLTNIVSVAAGFDHSMALSADGTVWTWGDNDCGQLGDAGPGQRSAPREISRMLLIQAIAAGRAHSMALKQDGTVWAWGDNNDGQLGDGTTNRRSESRKISGLSGVIAIAAGRDHSVALRNDGTVWAWGFNDEGQLGDGTKSSRLSAAQVPGLSSVTAIACGYDFTLALKADGTVWTWGSNDAGQLGDGTTEQRRMPVQSAGTDAVAIAAGREHVVILTKDGELKAWGSNRHGQLAGRRGVQYTAPVRLSGIDRAVKAIASGGYHLLIIAADNTIRTWGHNKFGQLGDRSHDYRYKPVIALAQPRGAASATKAAEQPRSGADNQIIMIAAGQNHSVALRADGLVWAWGDNFNGQLGDGERRTIKPYPQQVQGLFRVKAIATGSRVTLALREDGTVWAWGNNEFRQVGDGTGAQNRALPVQVAELTDVVAIAGGDLFSLAVKSDGTVWTWGVHPNSPGANMAKVAPVQVPGLANIVAVASGGLHALALSKDGTVWGWCDKMFGNMYGQVGDGTAVTRPAPVRVAGLTDVVAVAAGGKHSVALKKDGTVWAWGLARQITTKDLLAFCDTTPVQVAGLADITAIAAGHEHTIVLKRDGSLWGWGKSAQHQLGNQTFTSTPVAIANIANVAKIAAGWYHNLAVLKDGKLLAWGLNEYGQMGDGSQGLTEHGSKRFNKGSLGKMHPGPVNWSAPVSAAKSEPSSTRPDIKAMSAGGSHSALLMTDGTVWTWGDDASHQLGSRSDRTIDGTAAGALFSKHRPFPVSSLKDIQSVDAGFYHSLALKSDGTVIEWGRSYDDVVWEQRTDNMGLSEMIQHERSISRDRGAPAKGMNNAVGELTDVASVTAGYGFSLALKRDGTVWAWGANKFGQLGDGTTANRKVPRQVPGLTEVQALASGRSYVLALKADGSVWAWGAVGLKKQGASLLPMVLMKPVRIDGLSEVTAIAGGYDAFALKSDGTVWNCWQWDRDDVSRFGPAPVGGLTSVHAISARGAHLLALMNDESVRMVRHPLPQVKDVRKQTGEPVEQVEEITDAVEIAGGGGHSLVMRRDGTVLVWGKNDAGQLGDATEIASEMPLKLRIP